MSNKIKISIGKGVKPSKYTMNIISNIKSQLFREDNTISVGDKVKAPFELETNIQPELRKIGDVVDDFEVKKDGQVVLNKRTRINEDWTISTRETQVDMGGEKKPIIKSVASENGLDAIIEDAYVPKYEIEKDKSKILSGEISGQSCKNELSNYRVNEGINATLDDEMFYKSTGRYQPITINKMVDCNIDSNKQYTVIMEIVENTLTKNPVISYPSAQWGRITPNVGQVGMIKQIGVNPTVDYDNSFLINYFSLQSGETGYIKYRIMMVEGDWTKKEIGFFVGLGSTEATIETNSTKHSFYEPVIKGETKVVDGKLVSLESTDASLPKVGSTPSVSDTLDLGSGVLSGNTKEIVVNVNVITLRKQDNNKILVEYVVETKDMLGTVPTVVYCVSNKLDSTYTNAIYGLQNTGISTGFEGNKVLMCFDKSELPSADLQGVKDLLLSLGEITVRYQLATPIQTQLTQAQVGTYSQHKKVILLPFAEDKVVLNEDGSSTWVEASKEWTISTKNLSNAHVSAGFWRVYDTKSTPSAMTGGNCVWTLPCHMISFAYLNYCYMLFSSEQLGVPLEDTVENSTLARQKILDIINGGTYNLIYQLTTPTTTHIPKALTPTIPLNKINNLSVGGSVKPSFYKLDYPSSELETQLKVLTQDGHNEIGVTDKVKPSLFKGLFPVRKLVTATFATGDILKNIALKVIACNDVGENDKSQETKLHKPTSTLRWTYLVEEEVLKVSWTSGIPSTINKFKVKHRVDDNEYIYTIVDRVSGGWTHFSIPLTPTQIAEVSLCGLEGVKEHLSSDAITMSKDLDKALLPPTGFTSSWLSKNELQLQWNDDYTYDVDYELVYSIEGREEQVVVVPTSNASGTGQQLTHTITLKELETINARVRMRWLFNKSDWTYQTVLHTLAKPTNVNFEIVKEGTHITWETSPLAQWYKVYCGGIEVGMTTTNDIIVTRELNGDTYVVAYREGFISDPSESVYIKSKPNSPVNIKAEFSELGDQYNFNVSFIDNSQIETNYRVEYVVDDGEKQSITVQGSDVIPPNSVVDKEDPYKLWTLYEKLDGSDVVIDKAIPTTFNEDGTIATHKDSTKESKQGDYIVFTI